MPPLKNVQINRTGESSLAATKLKTTPINLDSGKNKLKTKPMKLKLIMPVGKGQDKEFTFNLDPSKFGGSSSLSF